MFFADFFTLLTLIISIVMMSLFLDPIYRVCETDAGGLIRGLESVRSWVKEHRRNQNPQPNLLQSESQIQHPAVSSLLTPPPTPPLPATHEPLLVRKRKNPGSPSPMSRAKRRDYGYFKATSSPWANELWEQRHSADLRPRLEGSSDTRTVGWNGKRLNIQPARTRGFWNPSKYESRSPSPPKGTELPVARVRFHQYGPCHPCPKYPGQFHHSNTLKLSRAGQEIPKEEEESLHNDIDETALRATDFTPLKPAETGHAAPNLSETGFDPVENTKDDESSEWDEDSNKAYRAFLRNQPETFDDQGYKLPIEGVISPPTQLWNEIHYKTLLANAAQEQQTPSRPSRNRPSSNGHKDSSGEKTASPPPTKVASGDKTTSSRPGTRGRKSPSPPRNGDTRDLEDRGTGAELEASEQEHGNTRPDMRTLNQTKFNQDHPYVPHTQSISAGPIQDSIQKLSLEPVPGKRTPKAASHQSTKEIQKIRTSQRLAALEAARDAYPLVPLSKTWDDKVRYAVNHGSDRFQPSMFNKCVPEYSHDPHAGSKWLDDAVINDYITMVAKHGCRDDLSKDLPSVSGLSSFFFTKISSPNPNYQSCDRMVKRAGLTGKKLLLCDKVFIPINQSSHWTLAVIEPKLSPDHRRTVTVYNSMGAHGGRQVATHVTNWIRHELGALFKDEEWQMNPIGDSPQQTNSDDCGVFTCTTARQIMLGRYQDPNSRYQEKVIRDMRKRIVAELVNGELLSREESMR